MIVSMHTVGSMCDVVSICLCLSVSKKKHTCFVYVHMGGVESLFEHESGT